MRVLTGVWVWASVWVWVGVTCADVDPTWMTPLTSEVEGARLEGSEGGAAVCVDLQRRMGVEGVAEEVDEGVAVCLRVRPRKLDPLSTLFTLTRPSPSPVLVVEVGHLGLWLATVREEDDAPIVSFFEPRLPPGTWRHLCVQQRPAAWSQGLVVGGASEPPWPVETLHAPRCFVDGEEEEVVPVAPSPGPEDRCGRDLTSCPGHVLPGGNTTAREGVWRLCVGGGRRPLVGEVADVRVWPGVLDAAALRAASLCPGRLSLSSQPLQATAGWVPQGNATKTTFLLQQVCNTAPRLVVVHPAGTYRSYGVVCAALGGTVPALTTLGPAITSLLQNQNQSCEGPAGLLSWVGGSPVGGAATEETCPALTTSGVARAACVRQLPCSVCAVPHAALYRLYGHDGSLFDNTFYLEEEDGRLAFSGAGGSRLEREGDGWQLVSALHGRRWTLAEAAVPVGRRLWTEGDVQTVLAVTVCRSGQFSCSDGQCVAQTTRCNDIVDCRDRSDEADCSVVVRPQGYDPYYPPPPRPGEVPPIDLPYHIDVYYVSDVTTEEGRAGMDVGVTLSWYDPRLEFLNLKPNIKNYFPCELVWTPRVRALAGHGAGFILNTDDYEKFCYTYASDEKTARPLKDPFMGHHAEGRTHAVEVYLGVLAWLPCHFRLYTYPFDVQLCNMSFVMSNAPGTRSFMKSSAGRYVPYLNARRVLLEYELHALTTKVGAFLQGTDNNTYFALTFHLRRLYGYHVTNSYFPSLLMFFISWATFFFQVDDFTNRIMISLTAQLVLAALFTSTNQSSVKTPYLKLIDVWYAAVITFCFVIVISQTVINVVLHAASSATKLKPSHRLTKVQPLFTVPQHPRTHSTHPADNDEGDNSNSSAITTRKSSIQEQLRASITPIEAAELPGLEAATHWNSVIRASIVCASGVFGFFYLLVCGGVFKIPGSYSLEGV